MPMNLDEELLMDEEENRRERQFVRQQLPAELKEKYSDDALQWILDTVVEYYFSSGILESADDEIDIDLEQPLFASRPRMKAAPTCWRKRCFLWYRPILIFRRKTPDVSLITVAYFSCFHIVWQLR